MKTHSLIIPITLKLIKKRNKNIYFFIYKYLIKINDAFEKIIYKYLL